MTASDTNESRDRRIRGSKDQISETKIQTRELEKRGGWNIVSMYGGIKNVANKGNGKGCNNKSVKGGGEERGKKTTYVRETNTASP